MERTKGSPKNKTFTRRYTYYTKFTGFVAIYRIISKETSEGEIKNVHHRSNQFTRIMKNVSRDVLIF